VHDAYRPSIFKEYMLRHSDSWVKFGQVNGHSVDYENLIFVTGVDLTHSYDMLTYATSSKQKNASFDLTVGPLGGASLSAWRSGRRPCNLWPRSQPGIPQGSSPRPRQCTFLRGWRLRSRLGLVEKLQGGAGPHELGAPPPPDGPSDRHISVEASVPVDEMVQPRVDAIRVPEGRVVCGAKSEFTSGLTEHRYRPRIPSSRCLITYSRQVDTGVPRCVGSSECFRTHQQLSPWSTTTTIGSY
jgi:hypothetical protein